MSRRLLRVLFVSTALLGGAEGCVDASKCPGYQLHVAKLGSAHKSRDPQWLANEARALVELIPESAPGAERNLRRSATRILDQLGQDPPDATLLADAVQSANDFADAYDARVCDDRLGALLRGEL
jgi:hypothetical protein